MYRYASFDQKNVNQLNSMNLPLWPWFEKTHREMNTYWLSPKEKVPGAEVSKETHADSLLGQEKTHHYFFSKKWSNCKQCFVLPTP